MGIELGSVGTDFEVVAALIKRAFSTNVESTQDYNSRFLKSCYEYPGIDPALSPAFFSDGRMIACLCSFPRRVIFGGRELRFVLLTLNSVDPQYRGYGLGIQTVTEAIRRAQTAGFDGAIFYCVDGNIANRTSVAGARAANVPCERVFTIEYLIGMLPQSNVTTETIPVDAFMKLAEEIPLKAPFARRWTSPEAVWQCTSRYGAISAMFEVRERAGILTGYIMGEGGVGASLIIEDLLWDHLLIDEKQELLRRFLAQAGARAQVAVVPLWNYADPLPFRTAGFRKSTRKLHAYLCCWTGQHVPERLESIYMDVF